MDLEYNDSAAARPLPDGVAVPDLKRLWAGIGYALAVMALLSVIALLVAMPE